MRVFCSSCSHPSGSQPLVCGCGRRSAHRYSEKTAAFCFLKVVLRLPGACPTGPFWAHPSDGHHNEKKIPRTVRVCQCWKPHFYEVKFTLFFLTPPSSLVDIYHYLHWLFLYHLYLKENFVKWDKYTSESPPELISITKPSPPISFEYILSKIYLHD